MTVLGIWVQVQYIHKSKVGYPHRSVKYALAIHYAYISLAENLFHLL
jgi:hypothetical protein